MSKVKELFGYSTKDSSVNWAQVVSKQMCPYSRKKCYKIRKSEPDISIGTCTVEYGGKNVMICPNRLLENNQIFQDCIHLMPAHEIGNELYLVPEVQIPSGNVDFFLVSVKKEKIVDFVGIELQTMDTTGTIWSERLKTYKELSLLEDSIEIPKKNFGMNWKMTAKTILVQMHHKIETFESLNKHLVLVVQEPLLSYMEKEFNFSPFTKAKSEDSLHIHSYDLNEGEIKYRLSFNKTISTDANGMAVAIGYQSENNLELDKILAILYPKLTELTKLQIGIR